MLIYGYRDGSVGRSLLRPDICRWRPRFWVTARARQVFSFCSLTPVGYWPVLNFEGAWNKPTLCTFTCIVGAGNCKNAYDIGDVGCGHLGGDHIDDRSI